MVRSNFKPSGNCSRKPLICTNCCDQAIAIDTSLSFIALASDLSRCDPGIVANHDVPFLKLNTLATSSLWPVYSSPLDHNLHLIDLYTL